VNYFLFDTLSAHYGGTGRSFSWDKLLEYDGTTPYFLSGGISLDSAEQLRQLDLPHMPYAVDINSRFEISPGMKDIDQISRFIRLLHHDIRND
jgi:phosphoribosylanthranilate isomerase